MGVRANWTTGQKWNAVLWLATDIERPDIVRALIPKGAKDKTRPIGGRRNAGTRTSCDRCLPAVPM